MFLLLHSIDTSYDGALVLAGNANLQDRISMGLEILNIAGGFKSRLDMLLVAVYRPILVVQIFSNISLSGRLD